MNHLPRSFILFLVMGIVLILSVIVVVLMMVWSVPNIPDKLTQEQVLSSIYLIITHANYSLLIQIRKIVIVMLAAEIIQLGIMALYLMHDFPRNVHKS